ncbi:MAG TPA: amidohydrolase family protein [Pyrinomonadaceae bacterium]|nr:amidohydrolase family protein [Pyrinomonadaceae bacterium]
MIDSHQHFWQVGRFDYPWMTAEVELLCRDYLPDILEPILQRNGVAQTVLVQASNSVEETLWLLKLAEENPFIAGVVGWVDLQSESTAQELDALTTRSKLKGIRHLVESEPADDWITQASVVRGLRELGQRGLTYDLLVHPRHLKYATEVVAQCPDTRFVVDHMAKPPIKSEAIGEWARELKPLAAFPNVSCKLSGLVTEANLSDWRVEDLKPYVETALEYFGPERMMFGSDWPVCLVAATYERVLGAFQTSLAHLNEDERRRIFSDNAVEFYRLEAEAVAA